MSSHNIYITGEKFCLPCPVQINNMLLKDTLKRLGKVSVTWLRNPGSTMLIVQLTANVTNCFTTTNDSIYVDNKPLWKFIVMLTKVKASINRKES